MYLPQFSLTNSVRLPVSVLCGAQASGLLSPRIILFQHSKLFETAVHPPLSTWLEGDDLKGPVCYNKTNRTSLPIPFAATTKSFL